MKTMVITQFGGPEFFAPQEMARPEPGPREVLVKVHAAAVNPIDYKLRANGAALGLQAPMILGYDAAGVVEQVGSHVSEFKSGDEVYYTPPILTQGTYAEFHAVDAGHLAIKPASLSFEQAAALPLVSVTAWDALVERTKLRPAETVLIFGCGGVGIHAVQIAKACGARVLVTGSDYMIDKARELGADLTINYKSEDVVAAVRGAVGERGVDVVFDTVGKGNALTKGFELISRTGRIASIVGVDTQLISLQCANVALHFVVLQPARYKLEALTRLVETGQLTPVIDSVVPIEEVAKAHEKLEAGGVKGKIVLRIQE